jgi:hypothetical protein
MKNPFKVGDTVYSCLYGEVLVWSVDTQLDGVVQIKQGINDRGWVKIDTLSFKPWPAPCHERPFTPVLKKGDVVAVIYKGNHEDIRYRTVEVEEEKCVWFTNEKKSSKEAHQFYLLKDPVKFN